MLLHTKHFGQLEIDEEGIVDFPEGLPGFEYVKRFILLGKNDEDSPFQWLQGVDNPDVAFVVIDPIILKKDYVVDVPDEEVEFLNITDSDKVMIFCIVVVPEDISKMTANLKAPVLINPENKKGKQIVTDNKEYNIKHYILEELRQKGG